MVKDTILYDRLGVSPIATEKELKKAYHKKSMKWHPDKNNSDEAKERFQEISEAYSILSDKDKRNVYDQVGIDMTKNGGEVPVDPAEIFKHFMGSMGGMGGFPFGSSSFGGANFGGGFMGNPFGNNSNANASNMANYKNCVVELDVGLEELYNEKTVTVNYPQENYCKTCNGYGSKDGKQSKCGKCDGSGQARITRRMGNMIQQIVRTCDDCNGVGEKIDKNNFCSDCNGKKFKIKNRSMEFQLSRKLTNGNNVTIKEKGNIYRDRKTDLIITIREKQHPVFTRFGNDLHTNINIKLYQLLFGLNKSITHLDGRKLFVNIPKFSFENLDEDLLYSIKDEGFTKGSNIVLHFTVDNINTKVLEENERTLLKKLLVKCDLNEFKEEVNLLKNKDNLVKTNVKKFVMNNSNFQNNFQNNFQSNFQMDEDIPNGFPRGISDGPPECTTQ